MNILDFGLLALETGLAFNPSSSTYQLLALYKFLNRQWQCPHL
jgi:hypothetical protein